MNDKRAFVVEYAAADRESVAALMVHGSLVQPTPGTTTSAWQIMPRLGFAFAFESRPSRSPASSVVRGSPGEAVRRRRHLPACASGPLGCSGVAASKSTTLGTATGCRFLRRSLPNERRSYRLRQGMRVFHFCHNPLILSLVRGRWLHFTAWRCSRSGHAVIWAKPFEIKSAICYLRHLPRLAVRVPIGYSRF